MVLKLKIKKLYKTIRTNKVGLGECQYLIKILREYLSDNELRKLGRYGYIIYTMI